MAEIILPVILVNISWYLFEISRPLWNIQSRILLGTQKFTDKSSAAEIFGQKNSSILSRIFVSSPTYKFKLAILLKTILCLEDYVKLNIKMFVESTYS